MHTTTNSTTVVTTASEDGEVEVRVSVLTDRLPYYEGEDVDETAATVSFAALVAMAIDYCDRTDQSIAGVLQALEENLEMVERLS